MAASNHRPRISLQFNEFDFRHRKVLEILAGQAPEHDGSRSECDPPLRELP